MKKYFVLFFFQMVIGQFAFAQCNAYFDVVPIQNTVYFDDTSTASFTSIHWDFGDGDSADIQNPSHVYLYPDTFIVCATITDTILPCTNTFCDTIIITCFASFEYTVGSTNDAYFTDNSFGSNFHYSWDFGDGTIDSVPNPLHTYTAPGTYYVCLDILDTVTLCSASFCNNVMAPCSAMFNYSSFPGNTMQFNDASMGSATYWFWDFGDGTTDSVQYPVHVYDTTGTYNVCLTMHDASSACSNTSCANVIVPCIGFFGYNTVIGDTVLFHDYTLGNPNQWHWTFGDGDTSILQNPIHHYSAPGMYYVCLTWSDSLGVCSGTVCDSVSVGMNNGLCSANFTFTNLGLGLVQLTDNSTGSLTHYYWDFGDGTTSTAPNPGVHFYAVPSIYTICLTVHDSVSNCTDTYCDDINLTALNCVADFNYNATFLDVSFTSTSTTGFGLIILYNWDFGDGSAPENTENPDHAYLLPGTYEVCLNFTKLDPPICTSNTECKTITLVANNISGNSIDAREFQIIPNPTTENTLFKYQINNPSQVTISVYDITGKLLETILNTKQESGSHQFIYQASSLAPGMYFVKITTGEKTTTRKLTVLTN